MGVAVLSHSRESAGRPRWVTAPGQERWRGSADVSILWLSCCHPGPSLPVTAWQGLSKLPRMETKHRAVTPEHGPDWVQGEGGH